VIEIFFDEAIERAKELDAYFEREGKTIHPPHGFPSVLRTKFNLKGIRHVSWTHLMGE